MFIEKDIMVKDLFWTCVCQGGFEPLCMPRLVYARTCVCQGGANGGNSWAASSRPHGGREEGGGNSNWAANWKAFPKQTTMANNRNLQTLLNFHSVTLQKHTTASDRTPMSKECKINSSAAAVSNGGGKAKFARGATFWSNIWFQPKHIESADLEFDSPPKQPPSLYCLLPHSMAPLTFLTAHYTPTGMRHTKCVSNSRWSYPLQLG